MKNNKAYVYGATSIRGMAVLAIVFCLLAISSGRSWDGFRPEGFMVMVSIMTFVVCMVFMFTSYTITISRNAVVFRSVLNPFATTKRFLTEDINKIQARCGRQAIIDVYYVKDGTEQLYSVTTNTYKSELKRMQRDHPDINIEIS